MNLSQFLKQVPVTATVKDAESNPNMSWPGASHYRVTLKHDGRQITVPFSVGSAHGHPTVYDVLESLAMECSSYDQARDLHDFMQELGYTSRAQAEPIYMACGKLSKQLRTLLGEENYETLLYKVDPNDDDPQREGN